MPQIQASADWANPEILSWARARMGLTVEQAARSIRLRAELVRAWEAGESPPDFAQLEMLADLYDCPLGYFFLESPPNDESPQLDFRGVTRQKLDILSYESRLRLGEFTRLIEYAAFLIKSARIDWRPSVGQANINDPVGRLAAETAANLGVTGTVRNTWSSGEAAFDGWRGAIESQNVLVLSLPLTPGELRGASAWHDEHPPAVLVNRSDVEAAAGRTFTLLHEYAHLMLRRTGIICDFRGQPEHASIETFANRLASEMIVPRAGLVALLESEDLNHYRPQWADRLLDKIREPFKASRDTIAIKLEQIGLAPTGFYHQRRAIWDNRVPGGRGRAGRRSTLAQRKLRDMGSNVSRIFKSAYADEALTSMDLAEILGLPEERVSEFLAAAPGPS